jgi:hypothetical protein
MTGGEKYSFPCARQSGDWLPLRRSRETTPNNYFFGAGKKDYGQLGFYNTLGGGSFNNANGNYTFVGGGCQNGVHACSIFSTVVGGCSNSIGLLTATGFGATFSFLGGGGGNCIDSVNTVNTTYGVLGGGQNNIVCASTNHSSIFSGFNNKVSGSCSSILGGANNCDNGFNYVGIFGCNVVGALNNAFHVNQLIAQNIQAGNALTCAPPASLATIPGALYSIAVGAHKQVWVV